MSRIAATFARLAAAGRKALVPFITAGDPSRDATLAVMHALVDGGADIPAPGVPFSHPRGRAAGCPAASQARIPPSRCGAGLAPPAAIFSAAACERRPERQ